MNHPEIAVAWSDWVIIGVDETAFLSKQFQLREDLLGTDVLEGWIGCQLANCFSPDEYCDFDFSDTVQFIDSFTLQCGVFGDTTHDDMEFHWDEVANLFRGKSMSYSEPE